MKKPLVRTVVTSMMGNLFEFYDFILFAYFAPILGKLFFPSADETTELIKAFGVFAVGFFVRPLGGVVFGHIGDKVGRKQALVLAILLMAIPTAVIGLLPTYEEIGISASILLVVMRMLQGFSMGGNYGGSITFTTEHSDPKHRGLIGSFAITSCLAGILLGSATATLFSYILPEHDLTTWGWRIPFLLGILICFVGYYLRVRIPESPAYTEIQESGTISQHPVAQVFTQHGKTLTVVVLATLLHDLSFYMLFTYMPTFMTRQLHLAEEVAFTINTINLFLVCVFTVLGAWLSDRVGRKPVMVGAAFIFIFGTIPLFSLITDTSNMTTVFWAQLVFAIAAGGYFGPTAAMMVEAFPTAIRFSAIAITTNISGPLFGGTAPVLVTYLIDKMGSNMVPAFYLTGAAVISLIALKFVSTYQGKGALKPA
ncbi:MAG: proP 1 [Alphaproteobacteria bacterium]|jgi:MHS family proline/betaine transporter-like MFS transporter|nr:proP 1 [Alphaproteobacteria bacterium]MDF3033403.1 proP 1 [Alphaproteobacteria bacterium]